MKQRILIIDDSFYMRTVLKNILEEEGYEVTEAESGEEGMKKIGRTEPDLITLDLILSDGSGMDFLKKIRQQNPDAKVVVISAVGQEKIVNQALDFGAMAYIVKPFEKEKVLNVIEAQMQAT